MRVGLTGSIAVGKSYVASVFAELGCRVLDADLLARQMVAPGSVGLQKVVEAFGVEVLRDDGTLDRGRLAAIVFADERRRTLLDSILHPLIIEAQDAQLEEWEQKDKETISIVEAALMIESGGYRRFRRLIVVHCAPQVQLQRLIERSKLSETEAAARIRAQMTQEEKKSYADYLIDTTGDFENTKQQTIDVYKELQKLNASLT